MNGPHTPPLVSVCIPTFNRAALLKRALEHLFACSYANIEIIVSDNGSTDGTRDLCEDLCAVHGNLRYFRHPVNRGPTPNFSFAREQARGKYFLWHGDDDYLGPNFIAECVDALESDPGLSLASGRGAYHHGDSVPAFYGNIVEPRSSIGLWRAVHFLFTVEEGSMFCGVYRLGAVKSCVMPNILAGDWAWLAQVVLTGKVKIVRHCHIYREIGANLSISYANIVAVLGLPKWHGRFPWFAVPTQVATYLAFRSHAYSGAWLPMRMAAWTLFFLTLFAKQVVLLLALKLPFGQRLHRRLFLDD
jgi:glycosyltransferase involved in cell wall biosynthesis